MFKDLPEGQTHSYGDGCGEPTHNPQPEVKFGIDFGYPGVPKKDSTPPTPTEKKEPFRGFDDIPNHAENPKEITKVEFQPSETGWRTEWADKIDRIVKAWKVEHQGEGFDVFGINDLWLEISEVGLSFIEQVESRARMEEYSEGWFRGVKVGEKKGHAEARKEVVEKIKNLMSLYDDATNEERGRYFWKELKPLLISFSLSQNDKEEI